MIKDNILSYAEYVPSSHCDARPPDTHISLLVIHNISLPPGQFDNSNVALFFTGQLDPAADAYFKDIYKMRVSAHCFIQRSGAITQFVPFDKRAWHAGVSSFQGQTKCNDYSIGIEMEGTDSLPYTEQQYTSLQNVTRDLMQHYPAITLGRIVGHNDIAPGRKTDPGVAFDWAKYRQKIRACSGPLE